MNLRSASLALLNPAAAPSELEALVDELFDIFAARVGLEQGDPLTSDGRAANSAGGVAISPLDAARCLRDYRRTAQFLRGLEAAVLKAQRVLGGARIRVLYAGCGPFAPMAVLLAPRFDARDVEFVLLDLHRRSLAAAAVLVESFDLAAHVRAYVEGDAATYRCADDQRPHVVVTETMQRALEKEPQVSIVANLAPQLLAGGSLVPEEVTLRVCLVDRAEVEPLAAVRTKGQAVVHRVRVELADVLKLNRTTRLDRLRPVRVVVPDRIPNGCSLMVRTAIRVHGDICLGQYDSGLTMPTLLFDLAEVNGGETVEFRYRFDPVPGLAYRVVQPGLDS